MLSLSAGHVSQARDRPGCTPMDNPVVAALEQAESDSGSRRRGTQDSDGGEESGERVPLPFWPLVKNLLKALGSESKPIFFFWQAVLITLVLSAFVAKSEESRLAWNVEDPQPPFMPWMSRVQRVALFCNDAMAVFIHWRLVGLASDPGRFQAFEKLCDVTVRRGWSTLKFLCWLFIIYNSLFQLIFFALTPGAFKKVTASYAPEPDNSQFPNMTLAPRLMCGAHILDSYDNLTAATEACDALNGGVFQAHKCAGIGIRKCSIEGPFDLCDSGWPPLATVDYSDCISVNSLQETDDLAIAWLRDATSPIHNRRYTVGMAVYMVTCCTLGMQLLTITFLLFFAVAITAAEQRMVDGVAALKAIPRDDPNFSSIALAKLISLQDTLDIIHTEFRNIIMAYFATKVLMVIYNVLDISLGTSSGTTAFAQLSMACMFLATVHLMLLPAAACTAESDEVIGAINELRYTRSEDGEISIVSVERIAEAECLSTFVRETNGGSGMGVSVAFIGKVTYEGIVAIATTLITVIPLLAGARTSGAPHASRASSDTPQARVARS